MESNFTSTYIHTNTKNENDYFYPSANYFNSSKGNTGQFIQKTPNILPSKISSSFTLNPNMATVIFKCKYPTHFGENVLLVGNIEELGCWEPSKGMKMSTHEGIYPLWESTAEVTGPVGMEVVYKYVIFNESTEAYHWEDIGAHVNRKFTIASDGVFLVHDEGGVINSYVQKIVGGGEISPEANSLPVDNSADSPEDTSMAFDCLSYDSNVLNSSENPFFFCMNQKISGDDRIIIASAHLPFEIDKTPEDNFVIRVTDESLIYSILYGMKEKEVSEVVWVGMLKNFTTFSGKELEKIKEFLRDKNIFLITVSETEYKNYSIYMNYILLDVFVNTSVDIHNKYFLNYEEYFASYMAINRLFGEEIYKIMGENDLIMINDVHLMLIPNSLLTKNTNARVGIYFHTAFPSSDVIKAFPYHQELLKSILLCDVIGFHVFQFARNFLTACKRLFGLFYEIKIGGFITLNYLGRHILIRIMHAGIDLDYIKSILSKKDFQNHLERFKTLKGDRFAFVSVDQPNERSGLLLKLEAFRRLMDKLPAIKDNVVLLQVIKCEESDSISEDYLSSVAKLTDEINLIHPSSIHILQVQKFSVPERFALFSIGECLFYLQIREGNCMYVNEFIALQHILQSEREKINFGIVISENIGVSSAIKGPFRINPFNLNSIVSVLEKTYYMKEEEKMIKFKKDLEHVLQSTTFSWIKNFFIDLKRTSTSSASTKIGIGMGLNLRLMKLNANFSHLNKNELIEAYRNSKRRLLVLDWEGTIVESDYTGLVNQHAFPSSRVVKLLNALTADPNNTIFIISGRERKHLNEWFKALPNLGLAAEHGFFYKAGANMSAALGESHSGEWNELFSVKDWSWKDSVLKILEGFTEKTEGSYVNMKDAIISWWYKDCDIYFGHVQANEIKTHMQNIFENCKLDFVNGKGYVEIKPQNVNKGYFLSYILKKMFLSKHEPDFIFAIGDGTNDEEMFNYLNSVNNSLAYLKEDIKIFTSTIGRKPSAAKFYLNEIHEVLEYLETLNQSKKDSRKMTQGFSSASKIINEFKSTPKRNTSFSSYDIHQFSNLNI